MSPSIDVDLDRTGLVFDAVVAGPASTVDLDPRGKPGEQGDPGPSAALPPRPVGDLPLTALPGQTVYTTDTRETYTWTGSQWLLTGRLYPTAVVEQLTPAVIDDLEVPKGVGLPFPELTTSPLTVPSGGLRVSTSMLLASGDHTGVEAGISYSRDLGETWNLAAPFGATIPVLSGFLAAWRPTSCVLDADTLGAGPVQIAVTAYSASQARTVGIPIHPDMRPVLTVEAL